MSYFFGASSITAHNDAYYAQLEARRQLQLLDDRLEQQRIDALPTAAQRLAANRLRYRCGADGYATLPDIPRWSTHAKALKVADRIGVQFPPVNTHLYATGGYFHRYGPPSAVVTAADTLRRFPPNDTINDKISLHRGDITSLEVDAIVNAANASLLGGGGIDGAIHAAAGPLLKEACTPLNGCPTGQTKCTRGFKLPARHVLHTVGPMGNGDALLQSCYRTSLGLLRDHGLRSLALCCVGTGIYGFPLRRATHIALHTVRSFMDAHGDDVDRIVFCVFRAEELDVYEKLMPSYFPIDLEFPQGGMCPEDKVLMFNPNDMPVPKDTISTSEATDEDEAGIVNVCRSKHGIHTASIDFVLFFIPAPPLITVFLYDVDSQFGINAHQRKVLELNLSQNSS